MSGASIEIQVDDKLVRRAFAQLERLMDDTMPIMSATGTALVASTHMRFVTQTDPDGQAWSALNPAYAATKRNSRILTESGRLRDSINSEAGSDQVRVGTNAIYAAIHQFGGAIKPVSATHLIFRIGDRLVKADSVTLPGRPFLGISLEDEAEIAEIVFGFLERRSATR
jgi:phage virion morphogenesis protein